MIIEDPFLFWDTSRLEDSHSWELDHKEKSKANWIEMSPLLKIQSELIKQSLINCTSNSSSTENNILL